MCLLTKVKVQVDFLKVKLQLTAFFRCLCLSEVGGFILHENIEGQILFDPRPLSLFPFEIHQIQTLPQGLQNKTTSRMGFGTDLQAKSCHDALLKLSEHEIRMLETMKKCLTLRVKYDKDYATALSGFISTAGKIDADNNTHESPVFSAWTTIVKQTEEISQLIKRNSESITENVINKLNTIIKEKIEIKRTYNHERNKLDGDFSKISDEVNDNYNKYVKSAKETQDARNKFEEVVNRGKGEKDVEKMKDKLRKATVKIHKIHNEYVLSIKAAEVHQDHYRSTMLPRLLDMHQQAQESHVSQIKDLLYKYASLTNFSSENYRNAFDTIDGSIKEINPEQEYNTFIEQYSSDFPEAIEFAFKTDLEDEYQDDYLKADEIAVDNLTIETVTHRHTELSDELTKCQENISEKEKELENLDIEIRSISPTEAEDTMISDLLDKQKTYREVFKSLGELKCLEAKLTAQYTALNTKLDELGDATPPAGIEFAYADVSKGSTLPSNKTNKSDSLGKKEKEKEKKKKAATKFFKKKPKQDDDHSSQGPSEEGEEYSEVSNSKTLDDEDWYHGCIPRLEAVELLQNNGDFLVRQKGDNTGQLVLSVKWQDKHKHFPIQEKDGCYRLEGEGFATVSDLIEYQLSSGKPVTKASLAVISNPIIKEWDLTHDDIIIGQFLGKGNFGDVVKGTLKRDNTPVAVKTCRENVDPTVRQKFLMEARILRQYDHPNIVKLVGVCTERHPIYIVMEFISGGDFLTFLRNKGGGLSVPQLVRMSENAAAGMAYLASKKCIHRDLAARNCLVGDNDVVKISDFGMSRQEDDGIYMVSGGMKQIPIKWTAPEAMNYGEYTIECDIWSYGILMWEIFSRGNIPYPGMGNQVAREKIENGYRMTAPEGTPPEVYDIMKKCWQYHPADRITFDEIHKILKKLCKTVR
ncbi:tyrosine-protein kinase Fer-like isoform X1 [Ptychodera flava]|uniref:tyrosine-protein kinase Fer-like isoform X1 n=1 Tax=Ptychodera flava TaxID=63121 RepID=UPI00396A3434